MKYETPLMMRNKAILLALFLFPFLALGQVITPVDLDPPSDTPRQGFQKLNTNDANIKARLDSIVNAGLGGGGSTTVPFDSITDLPTTLSGFGITDGASDSELTSHTSNTSNPHSVTKSQVGLGNVDNTSDADKQVSTATQTALDLKANAADVIYLSGITAYLGTSGVAASISAATAIDKIPTTGLSVGKRVSAIITVSGTERRLYEGELVTPTNTTAAVELSPSVIRPNDFNSSTNNKVWREVKRSGIIDVSNYGVVPDPSVFVSDQINAVISAASAGSTLIFPPGDYKIFAITVGKKLNLIGFGARFIFSTVNVTHLVINTDLTTIRGFTFVGQGRAHASYPNQGAINITGCSNVLISDCTFDQMPSYCIRTNSTHISDTSSDFGGINIVNCHMMRSKYGFYADTRGEYASLVGCTITDCDTGLYIKAGNINVNGTNVLDCSVGVELATGENDAHGIFTGCQLNHNIKAIVANDIENGHFFRSCNIYFGDIEITDSDAITFDNCTLAGMEANWDNSTGTVQNCTIDSRASTTSLITDWNGNESIVFTFNNKTIAGTFPADWNTGPPLQIDSLYVTGDAVLPASTSIGDVSSTEIGYVNGVTSAIQTQIDSKLTAASTASTGTDVAFDIPRTYGYSADATGNITFTTTGLVEGMTQLMIHNDSSEPTFETGMVVISGTYATGVDNYIMFMAVKSDLILVTISQEQ